MNPGLLASSSLVPAWQVWFYASRIGVYQTLLKQAWRKLPVLDYDCLRVHRALFNLV